MIGRFYLGMNSKICLRCVRWTLQLRWVWWVALLSLVVGPARVQSASNEFWQAQSIYQIITDRFFDGDPSNNNAEGNYNPSSSSGSVVHGGDFKGIEQKLDYIKALGATAIWISPIVKNANGQFHGYAAQDFYQVAPHWGTLADLQHMIQAAHARGILVINDVVVNHGGDLIYSTDAGWSAYQAPPGSYNLRYRSASRQYAAPFNTNAINPTLAHLFHNHGGIPNYNNPEPVELGELSGLDDFRTETDYVRTNMAAICNYWIAQGFDGFRIDTVKHVEMGFWESWCPAVHAFAAANGKPDFFLFGECYDGSDAKCGAYTGTKGGGAFKMDSVVDYPLYFKINSVFATASGNTKQLEDRFNAIAANYDPAAQLRLVTFLDNHDQARFLSPGNANNNTTRLDVALAFLYSARGIPCLYYGTEQAFNGETDPNDREDMFDGQFEQGPSLGDNFNLTHPQFLRVARLNNFRRLYAPLRTGTHVNKWYTPSGPGLFAYARRLGTQEVFVVFNTASTTQTLTNRTTIFAAGTPIVNLFDPHEVLAVTAAPETPLIPVPAMSAKIFVAQSDWQPLDPVVVSNSPAHDAANVVTSLPLVVQFSEPMDTNSVQAAFRTTPAVAGTFAWSATRDTMTFVPGAGLPALTNVTLRITNAISAVSGQAMFAPYEMRFHTAAAGSGDTIAPTLQLQTPGNGATVAGLLSVTGTATDNVAVQKVEVRLDDGPWLTATGTSSWNVSLNSSNFLNGVHSLTARATDTGNNGTSTNLTVRFFNIPGAYLQRVSAGNASSVTDCAGAVWLADRAYAFGGFGHSGGNAGFVGNTVTGICSAAQSLYQRERYSSGGGFFYQFDCPAGLYETTLLEAETYWSAAGQRVFNVFIQGQPVLTNFDLLASAGGRNLPWTRVFTNSVSNAQLQLQFLPVTDNARASGIQVRKIGEAVTDADGLPDWWRLAYFNHAAGQLADHSRAQDDADGDGASNQHEFLAGTDPLNAASSFRIADATTNGASVQLICTTVTNRTYQLQRRSQPLVPGGWTNVGLPVSGTGGTITLGDNSSSADATRFYRVEAH